MSLLSLRVVTESKEGASGDSKSCRCLAIASATWYCGNDEDDDEEADGKDEEESLDKVVAPSAVGAFKMKT